MKINKHVDVSHKNRQMMHMYTIYGFQVKKVFLLVFVNRSLPNDATWHQK